ERRMPPSSSAPMGRANVLTSAPWRAASPRCDCAPFLTSPGGDRARALHGQARGASLSRDAMARRDRRASIAVLPPPQKRLEGEHELAEVAAGGGMAIVWRGVHHGPGEFKRTVAVKQMHPHLASQTLSREMFFEEARIGSV